MTDTETWKATRIAEFTSAHLGLVNGLRALAEEGHEQAASLISDLEGYGTLSSGQVKLGRVILMRAKP